MKLSICMIVKNEEENLDRCLTSLRTLMSSLPSELIIVDTGSTDSTIEIARRYTEKVYVHEWNGDFSAMRNISFGYATGDWLLVVDADEELVNEQNLGKFLRSANCDNYPSGFVTIKSILVDGDNPEYGYNIIPRLFKNEDGFKYEGVIHEQPKLGRTIDLETTFLHYGYLSTNQDLMVRKFERNGTLLLKELEKDPNNIYYRYQLSVTYKMHNQIKDALNEAKAAFNLAKSQSPRAQDYLYLYQQLANCYIDNGMYNEAQKICEEVLLVEPDLMDQQFVLAKIYLTKGMLEKSLNHYKVYLSLVENFPKLALRKNTMVKFVSINKIYDAFLDMAHILNELECYNEALEYLKKCGNLGNQNMLAFYNILVRTMIKGNRLNELYKYFNQKVIKSENQMSFITTVENFKDTLETEIQLTLINLFKQGLSPYGLYNQLLYNEHIGIHQDNISIFNSLTKMLSDNSKYSYEPFSDLLYFAIIYQQSVFAILAKNSEDFVVNWLIRVRKKYNDLSLRVVEFLKVINEDESFESLRTKKILLNFLVSINDLSSEQYTQLFKEYIKIGGLYLQKIYSTFTFERHLLFDLKNKQEAFLMYMFLALEENKNTSEFISYTKQALEIAPEMARGVKILVAEREQQEKERSKKIQQFETYKNQVKVLIQELLNQGKTIEIQAIIEEYRTMVPDDQEINLIASKLATLH